MTNLAVSRNPNPYRRPDGLRTCAVLSIMHTGTVSLSHQLGKRRLLFQGKIVHIHEYQAFEFAEKVDVIAVPLRHPDLTYRSWIHRKRPMNLFPTSYQQMALLHEQFGDKIIDVPVDLPFLRRERLDELGRRIGCKLDDDLGHENVWRKPFRPYDKEDISYLWEHPFISNHYPHPNQWLTKTNL